MRKAIKGMTEEIMLNFVENHLRLHCERGSFIFMDQLSSHMTVRVRERMNHYGLIPVYFPPKTAPDLSPCDNFFFHLFKNEFRKLDRSTPLKKREAAFRAYHSVSDENVRACFRKCGLLIEDDEQDNQDEVVVVEEDPQQSEMNEWMMVI